MEKLKPLELVTYLIRNMGYRSFITSYCNFIKRDVESAMSILDTLIEECRGFETMDEWEDYAKEFAVKLQMQRRDPNKNGVCLSTFHSSKGLEWDHVILINSNDGKSPFIKATTEADFEEERRLYYVAVTRARKSVDIFTCQKRWKGCTAISVSDGNGTDSGKDQHPEEDYTDHPVKLKLILQKLRLIIVLRHRAFCRIAIINTKGAMPNEHRNNKCCGGCWQ